MTKRKGSDSALWRIPLYQQKIPQPIDNTKRHQNFDYTTIPGRLRMVSWNNNHPTVGLNRFTGSNLPINSKCRVIKRTQR